MENKELGIMKSDNTCDNLSRYYRFKDNLESILGRCVTHAEVARARAASRLMNIENPDKIPKSWYTCNE